MKLQVSGLYSCQLSFACGGFRRIPIKGLLGREFVLKIFCGFPRWALSDLDGNWEI